MRFKEGKEVRLASEWERLHVRTRELMDSLTDATRRLNFQAPLATHIYRTKDEQVAIYGPTYEKKGMTKEQATEKAMKRFTWHFCYTAIDLRDWIWTPAQVQRILFLAREQVANEPGKWEILYHDVGKGMHLHFAYKDESWKLREEEFRNAISSNGPGGGVS